MPKLPVVSGKAIITALEDLGFTQVRQRGSHVVLRKGGIGCVVPLHREVDRGTLASILKQAGVSAEQLIETLR